MAVLNDVPEDVVVKILCMTDQTARSSALVVNRCLHRIVTHHDEIWNEVALKSLGYRERRFVRERCVRNLTLIRPRPEDVASLFAAEPLRNLISCRIEFGDVDRFPDRLGAVLTDSNLERLIVDIDDVRVGTVFSIPDMPKLRELEFSERCRSCLLWFEHPRYPALERVRVRSLDTNVLRRDMPRLRRLEISTEYCVYGSFARRSLDRLDLEVDAGFDSTTLNGVTVRECVLRAKGYVMFAPREFATTSLRVTMIETECDVTLTYEALRHADEVNLDGEPPGPYVYWVVDVMGVPHGELASTCSKIKCHPDVTLNFVNVVHA